MICAIETMEKSDNSTLEEAIHENSNHEGGAAPATTNDIVPKRRLIVFLYILGLAFLHADYNLMAPNLTEIADEFGFTEDDRDKKVGGEVALAFFLCGIPSAVLVGWLTDKIDRRAIIFACVILIGEMSCFCTYFVKTYAELITTRAITGFSIGASLPIVYSVLGDLYQAEGRNAVSGLVATSVGLGLGVGQ